MPSLNDLGKFKASFVNIANEKKDILAQDLPFDDFELPTTEAPPFNPGQQDSSSSSVSDFDNEPQLPGGAKDEDPVSDFDFNAFINDPTGDESPPSVDDSMNDLLKGPEPEPSVEETGTQSGTDDLLSSDFNLEDFASDVPKESAPSGDFDDMDFGSPTSDDDAFGGGDLGADDPGGIDLGGESPDVEPEKVEPQQSPESEDISFDLGDDFSGDSINLGGESLDFPAGETSDDFSMDDIMPGFDSPPSEFQPSADTGSLDEDFSFDTGFSAPESQPDGDSTIDDSMFEMQSDSLGEDFSFDAGFGADSAAEDSSLPEIGDLGSDFDTDSIELEDGFKEPDPASGSEAFDGDDFALSGLDEILNKSKAVSVPTFVPKKNIFKKQKKAVEEPPAEDSIEEISLTQEDVDNIIKTLSSYPLNLKIVCQELIAEQIILPQQLSKLIRLLVNGAHVKETAVLAEQITGKPVVIPKSFEKMTGAAFEAEQSSFAYIFVHNFLPVLRLFAVFALLAASVLYLSYTFIFIPLRAESLYRRGYERIPAGEYQRANELFSQAFSMHRKKKWFYSYAEAFIAQRRFTLAEQKYDELLRFYPRDKKGVLDYANLNTSFLMNFEKANRLLQRELLDYAPDDVDGLLAAGDNFLAWADSNPQRFFDRYEDARFAYARLLELRGWQPPIVERMLRFFIRTDNLREVLSMRVWFENNPGRRRLSAITRAELGGYLLDKQLERPVGVPNPFVESIQSVRDMLLQAVMEDPYLPEPHYHLARYHNNLRNIYEERLTLENAIRAFDLAGTESIRRRLYRVDAHFRYANMLINNQEFFPAETQTVRGIQLFEDFLNRNLIAASPQLGQLYAQLGDLEYFVKAGDMQAALRNYQAAERLGFSPPEIQYRMGAAYYQLEEWRSALEYLFRASTELQLNRRLLFALGNAAFQRGDFFAAEGYYNRLLDVLEVHRIRLPVLLPNDNEQFLETGERLMMARNNLGVVYEALADQTGNREFRNRALAMYSESARAWDSITRHPETMTRMRLTDSPGAPSINLGFLNANNALRPNVDYEPQIFVRIDRDALDPSNWERLAPFGGGL